MLLHKNLEGKEEWPEQHLWKSNAYKERPYTQHEYFLLNILFKKKKRRHTKGG